MRLSVIKGWSYSYRLNGNGNVEPNKTCMAATKITTAWHSISAKLEKQLSALVSHRATTAGDKITSGLLAAMCNVGTTFVHPKTTMKRSHTHTHGEPIRVINTNRHFIFGFYSFRHRARLITEWWFSFLFPPPVVSFVFQLQVISTPYTPTSWVSCKFHVS